MLYGLERTSSRLADTFITPPLDVATLRKELKDIRNECRALHRIGSATQELFEPQRRLGVRGRVGGGPRPSEQRGVRGIGSGAQHVEARSLLRHPQPANVDHGLLRCPGRLVVLPRFDTIDGRAFGQVHRVAALDGEPIHADAGAHGGQCSRLRPRISVRRSGPANS